VDGARLELDGDHVRCLVAAHRYPFEGGILRLVPPDRRAGVNAESDAHEALCAREGRASPDEAQFKSLPRSGLPGYPEGYWAQQAASTALLWRFLEAIRLQSGGLPVGPMGEAAVIGAGMGWLAYALDVAGYTTLAIDSRAGSRYGLGVYPIARYLRVQADMHRLPLARSALDWLVFQDGLARFGDESDQERAFNAALDAVRPGGWVAVMGANASMRNGAVVVQPLLEGAGLELVGEPRRKGWRGRVLALRDRLTGGDAGMPPVVVAQKPH